MRRRTLTAGRDAAGRLSREITGEVIQELVAFVDVEAGGGFAGFVQLTA